MNRAAKTGPSAALASSPLTAGFRDLSGAFIAVVAFGIGFGAAAVAAGMSPATALIMSATVFAGAAQYAALDLWSSPLPLLSLALVTLAVNARHLVFGATLHNYLAQHGSLARHAALTLLSDANWAATQQAVTRGERGLGYFVGGGLLLWIAWMLGTTVGALAGDAVGDPQRFGFDAIMPAFFACSLISMARERPADLPPWLLAAALAALLSLVIPSQWAIIVGAVAGAVLGVLRDE